MTCRIGEQVEELALEPGINRVDVLALLSSGVGADAIDNMVVWMRNSGPSLVTLWSVLLVAIKSTN